MQGCQFVHSKTGSQIPPHEVGRVGGENPKSWRWSVAMKVVKKSDHVRIWEDYGDYRTTLWGHNIDIFSTSSTQGGPVRSPHESSDLMIFAHGLGSEG